MAKYRSTLARRLSRKLILWILVILTVLSYFVFHFTIRTTRSFYTDSYFNKMLINKEYIRRVLSDVFVAVTNNIYYLEHNLDNPDNHKDVMKRIVNNGTRIRSCGISFIKDYYPQKGHQFCPYAWRSSGNFNVIETVDKGDADQDYLDAEWFRSVAETDSAHWSEPFYAGNDKTKALSAYMAPVHDQEGRVVAVLGADVSLDWLTSKLSNTDSTINANASFTSRLLKEKAQTFIIDHDGKFITHPNAERILKDDFFSHVKENSNVDGESLAEKREGTIDSYQGHYEKCLFDGQRSYVFYTPVKYTDWTMVTIVPSRSIDTLGILNGIVLLLIVALLMAVTVAVFYYTMNYVAVQLQQITKATNDMAKGIYDTSMPEIKHDDEIHRLCNSLVDMQYSLSCYANEKKTDMK